MTHEIPFQPIHFRCIYSPIVQRWTIYFAFRCFIGIASCRVAMRAYAKCKSTAIFMRIHNFEILLLSRRSRWVHLAISSLWWCETLLATIKFKRCLRCEKSKTLTKRGKRKKKKCVTEWKQMCFLFATDMKIYFFLSSIRTSNATNISREREVEVERKQKKENHLRTQITQIINQLLAFNAPAIVVAPLLCIRVRRCTLVCMRQLTVMSCTEISTERNTHLLLSNTQFAKLQLFSLLCFCSSFAFISTDWSWLNDVSGISRYFLRIFFLFLLL